MTDPALIDISFRGKLGTFELDAAFTAPSYGTVALFGPSGCGKTSILRCIAGLQRLKGHCMIGEAIWQKDSNTFLPAYQRQIGYVFQEARLFPHLNAQQNLLFALRGRKPKTASGNIEFDEIVSLLGLDNLLSRTPGNLSGGEQQRVAIGRALLSQPKLLLMDEPLSALDQKTREDILPYFDALHETLSIPMVYVTHDRSEVERLADHLVLIDKGCVIASGSLDSLQSDPAHSFARQRDAAVSLDGHVAGYDGVYGLLQIDVPGCRILLSGPQIPVESHVRLRISSMDVSLTLQPHTSSSILNIVPARILEMHENHAHQIIVVLGLGEDGFGARILSRITCKSRDMLGLKQGMLVHVQIKGAALSFT